MAIKYCDWITGNDTTGDGSAGNPYRKIDKASTGLTGGDEVRVAKSPAPTVLSGTLAWVDGSDLIATSIDLTLVLSPGDFVGKDTSGETWWEVITVTTTTLTLYKIYSGTTETVASKKLGITSTGLAGSSGQNIQSVFSSGISSLNRLKISGGWNLSTELQDGETWFRQMHTTFSYRYGRGLYTNSKSFLEIEKLNFLRYYYGLLLHLSESSKVNLVNTHSSEGYGISVDTSSNAELSNLICNANDGVGLNIYESDDCNVQDIIANSNDLGVNLNRSHRCQILSVVANRNDGDGIKIFQAHANLISNITAGYNTESGIKIDQSHDNTFEGPIVFNNNNQGIEIYLAISSSFENLTCNNNSDVGIYSKGGLHTVITKYSGSGNINGDVSILSYLEYYDSMPSLYCQHFGADKVDKIFYVGGIIEHITGTEARGGSGDALRFSPLSDIYYLIQKFYFPIDIGVGKTLKVYMKDDVSFNGEVQAAIYFLGKRITGWSTWSMTTNYVEQNIIASSGDITEDGVLELRIRVKGAAGNVYLDDISEE